MFDCLSNKAANFHAERCAALLGKKIHIGLSVLEKIIYGQSKPLADIQVGIFRTQAICFSRHLKIKKSWCEWPYERTRATNTGGERPRRMEGNPEDIASWVGSTRVFLTSGCVTALALARKSTSVGVIGSEPTLYPPLAGVIGPRNQARWL